MRFSADLEIHHIANVRIRREVERMLANRGFTNTTICTPEEPL